MRPLDDALIAWATPIEVYPRWQLAVVLLAPLLLTFRPWFALVCLVVSHLIARIR